MEPEPPVGEPTMVDDGFTDAELDEEPMMGDDVMMGDTMMGIEPAKPERKRSDFERLLQGLNRADYRPRVHLTARLDLARPQSRWSPRLPRSPTD